MVLTDQGIANIHRSKIGYNIDVKLTVNRNSIRRIKIRAKDKLNSIQSVK